MRNTEEVQHSSSGSKFKSWHALLVVLAIIVIWVASVAAIMILVPNWSDRGTFGDMFGAPSALFSGLALAGVIYAIILQRQELQLQRHELKLTRRELQRSAEAQEKDHALGQIRFLISLSSDFLDNDQKFNQAWQILRNYPSTPKEMTEQEWHQAIEALRKCYESTLFLYQMAKLSADDLINKELLYLLYYEKIMNHADAKLRYLVEWCGTGVDLAANYEAHEVVRMIGHIKDLLGNMERYHREHHGEPYEFQLKNIEKIEKELTENLSRYDISSDDYIDNYISVSR